MTMTQRPRRSTRVFLRDTGWRLWLRSLILCNTARFCGRVSITRQGKVFSAFRANAGDYRTSAFRSGPGFGPDLNMVAIAPDGEFAAHCGIWHQLGEHYSIIEPVATVPEHRRKGLARAVIRAAIERAAARNATEAWVGSA